MITRSGPPPYLIVLLICAPVVAAGDKVAASRGAILARPADQPHAIVRLTTPKPRLEWLAPTEGPGCSSAWLERCVRDAEVEGSNPFSPTDV